MMVGYVITEVFEIELDVIRYVAVGPSLLSLTKYVRDCRCCGIIS